MARRSGEARPSRVKVESGSRKEPRWTISFLLALERTGDVRASAEDAGIDHSTAYARRRAHAEFALAWDDALRLRAGRAEEERARELEELEAARAARPLHHPPDGPPPRSGEELSGARAQLRRAGHDRWSARKEKLFFDELAATANVKRAAKAAGVSPNAVYQRRMRDAHFKAKWAAVLETGRAAIEMHLVEAANRSFEPDELEVGEVQPKVSVAEAIRITQGGGSRKVAAAADPYDDPNYDYDDDMAEIREGLVRKLQALRRRERPALIAQGWSFDEEYDREVPPGWVRVPGWPADRGGSET